MNMNLILIAGFGVCLLLSGFFSASETALTSLSATKTRRLFEINGGRHGRFRALQLWLDKPDVVLTTILVCNNLVNTLCAAIATILAQHTFGSYALGIATGIATLAILLVGEISPKIFAKHNAEYLAPSAIRILAPVHFVVSPIAGALTRFATTWVSLPSDSTPTAKAEATQEELAFLIRLGHKQGVFQTKERQMLESIVGLRNRSVRFAMTPRSRMHCLENNMSLDTISKHLQQHGYTRCPIYNKTIDNIAGVFHAQDLIHALTGQNSLFHLKDYVRPALFISEKATLSDLLKKFQQSKTHLAIVVDNLHKTVGSIELEDVLEEIVGDIRNTGSHTNHLASTTHNACSSTDKVCCEEPSAEANPSCSASRISKREA